MNTKDDGGSAFPEIFTELRGDRGDYHPDTFSAGGMTLRDYFAAEALGNFFARNRDRSLVRSVDEIASDAYSMADAMLKARSA